MLQSAPWADLIEIPEIAILTGGKRAGYLLGMAYLASQELRISIQRQDFPTYVLVKADGLFAANVFKNGSRVSISFETPLLAGHFKGAAITVLEKAAASECQFSSGWYRNDAREIDFLHRTCTDLKAALDAREGQTAPQSPPTAQPVRGKLPAPPPGSTAGTICSVPSSPPNIQGREQEIAQRSRLTLEQLRDEMGRLVAEDGRIQRELQRNAFVAANPRLAGAYGIRADQTNRNCTDLIARLTALREEQAMQSAASEIVQARIRKEAAAEAEGKERTEKAAQAIRERFAASAYGQKLYSVIFMAQMGAFERNNPSPLPSEQEAGQKGNAAQANCIVRRISPQDPDHMTADERAVIEMIIRDLSAGRQIENRTVGELFSAVYLSCVMTAAEARQKEED